MPLKPFALMPIAAAFSIMTSPVPATGRVTDILITAAPADSTERNVRDRGDKTQTPLDQGNSRGDLNITAAIRRAVTQDKSLSTDAHNIKIITQNGNVTLRGPVASTDEKTKIETTAKKQRRVKAVTNELEVKIE